MFIWTALNKLLHLFGLPTSDGTPAAVCGPGFEGAQKRMYAFGSFNNSRRRFASRSCQGLVQGPFLTKGYKCSQGHLWKYTVVA